MRGFFNKVAEHIDKLDAEGQRKQYRLLVEELSFYESQVCHFVFEECPFDPIAMRLFSSSPHNFRLHH